MKLVFKPFVQQYDESRCYAKGRTEKKACLQAANGVKSACDIRAEEHAKRVNGLIQSHSGRSFGGLKAPDGQAEQEREIHRLSESVKHLRQSQNGEALSERDNGSKAGSEQEADDKGSARTEAGSEIASAPERDKGVRNHKRHDDAGKLRFAGAQFDRLQRCKAEHRNEENAVREHGKGRNEP